MFKRIRLLGILFSLSIFLSTCLFPTQFHLEFIYSLVVLMTIWSTAKRTTFGASVFLTGLIIIGFIVNQKTGREPDTGDSFILPILFIWAFTFAIIKYKQSQENLIRSTENLNAMFHYATEGIVMSNSKGIIIMANPRACEQFGYEHGTLSGHKIEELIPTRFSKEHPGHRDKYYKERHNRSMGKGMSLYAKKADGTEFPVEISLSSYKNKEEVFVISFIIDITERKKQEAIISRANEDLELRVIERTKQFEEVNLSLESANKKLYDEMHERIKVEEALRDSERLYSTIARNFPQGIIIVLNSKFEILFIDGKELSNLELQRNEILLSKINLIEIFKDKNELPEILNRVFKWESIHFDTSYKEESYSVTGVPLPDTKGFIREILLVIQNVSELKTAEKEILQSLAKEKELNELKSKFVSIASHEFRTPLSTILTSVTLIAKYDKEEDKEKRHKHIDRIKSSIKNLTEILNDFLSLEKLEAGKIESVKTDFDYLEFATQLCEEMNALAKPGQNIELQHSGEAIIHSDKQVLRHICMNLLNNAIKYSPENSSIEYISYFTDKEFIIKIQDHGIGIPSDDQQHLFDRFFRAGNVTAIQGTGLGLNIIRKYVELLNGNIKFDSTEGKGSTFTLHFPLL